MDRGQLWRVFVPATLRRLPTDLGLVTVYLGCATAVVVVPGLNQTVLRPMLALPLVLFVPGYLFVAALFPEAGPPLDDGETPDATDDGAAAARTDDGIDGIERVALSFGTSIAIVPLIGLVLNFTPFGIRLVPILISLLLFCGTTLGLAARRRAAVAPEQRFSVDVVGALVDVRTELTQPDSRADAALNVLLVVSVLLAVSSVGYAVAVPKQGEAFTELYLLTEGEDGELVADGYPTELVQGEPASLVVGVGNHEHERVDYTVVVALQRVTPVNESGNTTVRVDGQRQLQRFSPTLADNETWERGHTVTPPIAGERLRLIYLLYRGDAPAAPSTATAYREVHLWVNVTASS